jgi:hypothetical protein
MQLQIMCQGYKTCILQTSCAGGTVRISMLPRILGKNGERIGRLKSAHIFTTLKWKAAMLRGPPWNVEKMGDRG